ncbi:MAG: hypothetical protein CMJ46_00805 [Planctomyces sp.]|nr:hypothetical protein [Planctomyces sp.]
MNLAKSCNSVLVCFRLLCFLFACFLMFPISATAAERWGDLKGRFVYDGAAPKPRELELNKDIEYCAPKKPTSLKLLVNKENNGLKNVVLYLYLSKSDPVPPIHPDYEQTADSNVLLDNIDCQFQPHVTLLRTSQTLKITNSDDVAHNTAAFLARNNPFNAVTPIGESVYKNLESGERLPVQVSCSIHPWMQGWLLVQEHPYMAVTDADGNFEIKNLPAGEWTFQVWHEAAGYLTDVTQNDEATSWPRGRITVTIANEPVNLGTVKVAADKFTP